MSDIVKSLEWSCRDPVTHEPIDDGDYSNATVSEVKQAIAEITRLRAELDTARRQGMEEAAKIAAGSYPDESRYDPRSPLYGMDLNPDRSEFGRGKEAGRKEAAAAIARAAAKEDRQP